MNNDSKMEDKTECGGKNSDTEDMIEPNINGVKIDWNVMEFLNQALQEHQVKASMSNIEEKE